MYHHNLKGALEPWKEWRAHMVDKEYVNTVREHVKLLHKTRSIPMFDALATVTVKAWTENNATDLVAHVKPEYVDAPYNHIWNVGASKRPGITASSQPLESWNDMTKECKMFHLRQRLDEMLHKTLPHIHTTDYYRSILRQHRPHQTNMLRIRWTRLL